MSRMSWLAAVAAAALAAACVNHQNADTSALRSGAGPSERSTASSVDAPPPETSPPAESAATAAPPATPAPTTPATPGTYTDAQLRAFIAASEQIDPLNRQLTTATGEQRTALAAQIRAALQANNLDAATYNAIAAQAQTDTALAARINSLRTP